MKPREFVRRYRYDDRLITGAYFSEDPLQLEPGDRVGVVLLNLGGPETTADVEPFLYNLFMDPAIIDLPVGGVFRHLLARFISRTRARKVARDYEAIGGGSPINLLTRQQARSLENMLQKQWGRDDVSFRVYIAMRYWHPTSEEAAQQMEAEGITKVILLPLYPQYSKTTTGSSLLYWWMLQEAGEIPRWPTAFVYEYATHPKYVRAIGERIDEALQRFPADKRDQVHLLFSAHGTPLRELVERKDPYCCLVHATVEHVMRLRGYDHPYHVAFQSKVGPAEWLTPSTPDKLKELAERGVTAVTVVPVAFVSDHIETSFELDIEVREEAHALGIRDYEVTTGLNCHPLFIEALAEVTRARFVLPGEEHTPVQETKAAEKRTLRCHQCLHVAEARDWITEERLVTRSEEGGS